MPLHMGSYDNSGSVCHPADGTAGMAKGTRHNQKHDAPMPPHGYFE